MVCRCSRPPPAGLRLTDARPFVGTYAPTTLRWTIGHLAPGMTVTLQIDAVVVDAGLQTNHVHVSGTGAATEALGLEAVGDTETRLDNNDAEASVLGIVAVSPPGVLPSTGIDSWFVVRLDLLVVAAGGMLLIVARRRRRPRRS